MSYVLDFNLDGVEDPDAPYPVDSPEELDEFLELLSSTYAPTGLRVLARLGPAGAAAEMLFGLNDGYQDDADRAVVQWLPTGEYGTDPTLIVPMSPVRFDAMYLDGVAAIVTFAAESTRVTPTQLRQALVDYLATGDRSPGLDWTSPELR